MLKVPLPRTESPPSDGSHDGKRKLPEIKEKKSKPYLKAKARQGKTSKKSSPVTTASEEDKGGTVEEYVLAMVDKTRKFLAKN